MYDNTRVVHSLYKYTRFMHACRDLAGLCAEKHIFLHTQLLSYMLYFLVINMSDHNRFLRSVHNIPGFYMHVDLYHISV